MKWKSRLLFGPLAGIALGAGIVGLALMVPGYSHVHQTVSEIGEMDSPARVPFEILLCFVAACILIFASAVRDVALEAGRPTLPAYVIGCTAISVAGVGIFAFPHPLHNVFGLSEIIGYQAPAVLALAWRHDGRAGSLVVFSWIMFAFVWIALGLNMSAMDRHGSLWAFVKPEYGLVQRALFAVWFAWLAVVGLMLLQRKWRSPFR
jgi:hypothetical membrane protein